MLLRQSPSGPAVKLPSFPAEFVNHNVAAVASIDWSQGPAQVLVLTANATVSQVGLPAGQPTWVQLKVIQGGAGSFVPTFAGQFKPGATPYTWSTTPGSVDIISIYWDGQNLWAPQPGLAFQ